MLKCLLLSTVFATIADGTVLKLNAPDTVQLSRAPTSRHLMGPSTSTKVEMDVRIR